MLDPDIDILHSGLTLFDPDDKEVPDVSICCTAACGMVDGTPLLLEGPNYCNEKIKD